MSLPGATAIQTHRRISSNAGDWLATAGRAAEHALYVYFFRNGCSLRWAAACPIIAPPASALKQTCWFVMSWQLLASVNHSR
jgi:hypothetical protein